MHTILNISKRYICIRILACSLTCLGLLLSINSHAATPLIEAINAGNTNQALALIGQGVDVNEAEPNGTTALHWAVYHNNFELVERLLRAEANPNASNQYHSTPITEAAFYGNTDVVKSLLEAGADVNSTTPLGQNNLMVVARTNNTELARLLLENGADVNAQETTTHQNALMWASSKQQAEMVKVLIEFGAKLDAQTIDHDWAVRVSAEPRVSYQATGGFTSLLFATRENCLACVQALIKAGAGINKRDPDGTTALNLANQNGHFDIAKYLIEQGADVNLWDWWGRAPLFSAVDMNTIPVGGRTDLPTMSQTTPIEIIEMLLKHGANPNMQLKFLVPFRNVGSDRGGDLVINTGATALLRAAKAGDTPTVRLLLKYGANTALHTYENWLNWWGGTRPLPAAAGLSYQLNDTRGQAKTQAMAIETIDLLLAAGADINVLDTRGRSAVFGAVFRGWDQVLTHLAENGVNLRQKDKEGTSPLDVAQGNYQLQSRETVTVGPDTASLLESLLQRY